MKKLPTITKIIYGFGDIGFSMTGTIIAAYFNIIPNQFLRTQAPFFKN
jgi:hypothetical protein